MGLSCILYKYRQGKKLQLIIQKKQKLEAELTAQSSLARSQLPSKGNHDACRGKAGGCGVNIRPPSEVINHKDSMTHEPGLSIDVSKDQAELSKGR